MDFSQQGEETGSKLTGITVVVLVHAILIYALLTGLGKKIISVIKEVPLETKVIEEVKPPPPPPDAPPPPPKLAAPPPPFIPPPEVQVAQQPTPNAITAVSNVQPPHSDLHVAAPVAAKPSTGPSVVKAVVDFSTCERPDYPRNSLRNEEQGTTRLTFLIGLDGKVADSKIEKSSGFRALDAAAKNALSLCKFKPGSVDGKPQQSWTAVDYVWKLPD